jgi:hypothetical protein
MQVLSGPTPVDGPGAAHRKERAVIDLGMLDVEDVRMIRNDLNTAANHSPSHDQSRRAQLRNYFDLILAQHERTVGAAESAPAKETAPAAPTVRTYVLELDCGCAGSDPMDFAAAEKLAPRLAGSRLICAQCVGGSRYTGRLKYVG